MKLLESFLSWLQEEERKLARNMGLDEPDFDDIHHTLSDEALEEMVDYYARTTSAPNTTPVWNS